MQQDVDQVISRGVVAPEVIFNPVGRVDHWVVLRGRADFAPYLLQTLRAAQRLIFENVIIIVPDVATLASWQVDGKGSRQDGNANGHLASERLGLHGIRRHEQPGQLAMVL